MKQIFLMRWMMSEIITAVYENGILRPLEPLSLQERQRVRIQILVDTTLDETEQIIQALIEAGELTPPPGVSDVEPISEEETRELANTLGKATAKPLSEIIIEDRGEW
jgi:predicted DNA-binding antitoxin AbrB/MazE fold protein